MNKQQKITSLKVFVVEDDDYYRELLTYSLSLNPEFEITAFNSGEALLKRINEFPDVVTLDYYLPKLEGEALLKKVQEKSPDTEVIIISKQEKIETAVNLLKLGAYDYVVKTNDIRERLLHSINKIVDKKQLKRRIASLEEEVKNKYDFQKTIIGNSDAIKNVFSLIEKATSTNITVSITGETGTGKEVVAKAIHYNSKRKNKPFVAVNMAAIPSELIESELFGHEKGAFTGATTLRKGKFEEASEGTIFLDEIGEMDITFQVKLLRILQEKEITRIGGNEAIKVDCRIIVATNRNLELEVKEGRFREDLFYRLFGLPIHLPPLRDRDNDVLILAKFFIDRFCAENEMETKVLSDSAKVKILNYQWPGNVREIKSVMEGAVVMASSDEIHASDITLPSRDILSGVLNEDLTLREYNLRIVSAYLKRYNNDTKIVAEKLSIGQTTIYRMLKEVSELEEH